ncbi:unnamed protein product [Aspergillus oryzae]|nr:unnamed protein product [Aspergillus oryzae]GMF91303.1 unnamed protein product [Aspergillus oryzae]
MKNIEDDYFPILEIIQGIDMHESNSRASTRHACPLSSTALRTRNSLDSPLPFIAAMSARTLSHSLRSRCLLRRPQNIQGFSTRTNLRAADHGDHYDPPTGWLFGVKPGQKYVKEGWENIWYYGFIGSLLVAGVAYVFKPDTSYVNPLGFGKLAIISRSRYAT